MDGKYFLSAFQTLMGKILLMNSKILLSGLQGKLQGSHVYILLKKDHQLSAVFYKKNIRNGWPYGLGSGSIGSGTLETIDLKKKGHL